MTNQGSSEIMIEQIGNNRVRLSSAGQMAAGSFACNPQWIRIEGPTLVIAPKEPLTEQEYSQWRINLVAKGFTITETNGPFS